MNRIVSLYMWIVKKIIEAANSTSVWKQKQNTSATKAKSSRAHLQRGSVFNSLCVCVCLWYSTLALVYLFWLSCNVQVPFFRSLALSLSVTRIAKYFQVNKINKNSLNKQKQSIKSNKFWVVVSMLVEYGVEPIGIEYLLKIQLRTRKQTKKYLRMKHFACVSVWLCVYFSMST